MMYNSIQRIEYIYIMSCKWNLKTVQALENLVKDLDILENDILNIFLFCTLWHGVLVQLSHHNNVPSVNSWWYHKEEIKEYYLNPWLLAFIYFENTKI